MINPELLLPEEEQLELAIELHQTGMFGIVDNPDDFITLKSERRSPHYLNIRPGISSIHSRDLITGSMVNLMAERTLEDRKETPRWVYDHVVGTPEAMTSYAAMIATEAAMSLLQPRVDTKKVSGNKAPIVGEYTNGDIVAAFDDVITDGESKIQTIDQLSQSGLVVADYFVVLDREEGGVPQVKAETGLKVTPAIGVSSLVKILQAESMITQTQFDNVAKYMAEYGEPHAKDNLGV